MVKEKKSLQDIIAGLKGFGIEESEDIITINASGKKVQFRISNTSMEDEVNSLLASEEYKGHMWIQRVRCEILSRSITWINGVSVTGEEYVLHPMIKEPTEVNIRVALRDIINSWGTEVTVVLWKILMVHNQKIEDRLIESLPDSTIMTNIERRFLAQTMEEIEGAQKQIINDTIEETMKKEQGDDK